MKIPANDDLTLHLPLSEGISDPRVENLGVVFDERGAVFDGQGAHLVVRDIAPLKGDFTVAAWIWTPPDDTDYVGDLVSQFDPHSRTGMALGVVTHGGVTSSQSNYRNLQCFVDFGSSPQWTDCGRPGQASFISSLAVHQGCLYAGTFEHGEGLTGDVYRYVGPGKWEDCGLPTRANCVSSLLSFNGSLFAATGCYDSRGSALGEPRNDITDSRVWRFSAEGRWIDCGTVPGDDDLLILGLHHGSIYGTPNYRPGLYRYMGGTEWRACAAPVPRFFALCSWRGHLYAATNASLRTLGPPPRFERSFVLLPEADGVYRYDDCADTWTGCGRIEGETQMYTFAVHQGQLHVGTWPSAKVLRSSTGIGWDDLGNVNPDEKEIMGMAVYNGKLYVGTLPAADVFRLEGRNQWTRAGNTDQTPNVTYRRAWSMAVHEGKLFVGTLPSGHVHAMQTGCSVSDSHQLPSGWQHVAAVRRQGQLQLYRNGKACGQAEGVPAGYVSPSVPLLIGHGPHEFFRGTLRDLHFFARGLDDAELERLQVQTAIVTP